MHMTYAVSWQEPDGSPGSGRLELGADALLLEGRNGRSGKSTLFPYGEIAPFRPAPGNHERLQARPTLIVDLGAEGPLRIAGVAQPGIVSELASRLAAVRHDTRP